MEARAQQEKADAEYARQLQFGEASSSDELPAGGQQSSASSVNPQIGGFASSSLPPTRQSLPWNQPNFASASSSSNLRGDRFFGQHKKMAKPTPARHEIKKEGSSSVNTASYPLYNNSSASLEPSRIKHEEQSYQIPQGNFAFPNTSDDDSDLELISATEYYKDHARPATQAIKPESGLGRPASQYDSDKRLLSSLPAYMPATGNVYGLASSSYPMPGSFPHDDMRTSIFGNDPAFNSIFQYGNNFHDLDSDSEEDQYGYGARSDPYGLHVEYPHDYDTKEHIQSLLANIRPDEDLPAENREGTPDGLKYPLVG